MVTSPLQNGVAGASKMPIAIVGMSCRFPGDATSPEKLWQMCAEGRSAWSKVPRDRWNSESFFHPNKYRTGSTNVRGAHFLSEDIALFDAPFFNVTIEEAKAMDPQLRLQLECTYEALENAGITISMITNTPTSVYSGVFGRDYHDSLIADTETLPRYFNTGNGAAMLSNRLSYFFDLKGPSLTVDTGCSTSLVAFHLGCQSLRAHESSVSIIGASNLIFRPDMTTAMTNFGFLSPEGKSFTFDHRADGYGRGEGVASIIIKPLSDAIRDGDPIRAVIRETGLNQDGRTVGITLPNPKAQEALIRSCYQSAHLDPSETPYVEAHGTGTVGDQLESAAISAVFSENRSSNNPLYVASVKTNVGHTEATSGLAGIIKAVMALEKGFIPPSINFEEGHPKISFDKLKIKVPGKLERWPRGIVKRASVNSFGYGGTNGHVILDQIEDFLSREAMNGFTVNGVHYPVGVEARRPSLNVNIGKLNPRVSRLRSFVLSAYDQDSGKGMISKLAGYLKFELQGLGGNAEGEQRFLDNLAYTLSHRRTRLGRTAAFSAESMSELVETLEGHQTSFVRRSEKVNLGFVFTGQGSQWFAMGRELIHAYPVFEEAILAADRHLKSLGAEWTIMGKCILHHAASLKYGTDTNTIQEELHRDERTTKVNAADFSQPICTAVQVALARLLESWNIRPVAVTCHSSGEVAAAYAAGALTLEEAITVSYYRGLVTTRGRKRYPDLKGGMAAVGLSREDTQAYVDRVSSGKILAACINSPSSVTVSGDLPGIEELILLLEADSIFVRKLMVDAAYHSHHMNLIADEYRELLRGRLETNGKSFGNVEFWSSVIGDRIHDGTEFGAEYWIRNMVNPVLFVDSLRNMCLPGKSESKANVNMLVEVGPHSALAGPIRQIFSLPELKTLSVPYTSCLVRKKDAVRTMVELAGILWSHGYPVDLAAVNYPHSSPSSLQLKVLCDLPPYFWSHKIRHWFEPRVSRERRERKYPSHDLLGIPVVPNAIPGPPHVALWRHIIRPSDVPWLRDHVVQNDIVYPGAGYVSMAIEGVKQLIVTPANDNQNCLGYKLRDVKIVRALIVPETADGVEVQMSISQSSSVTPGSQTWREFHIYSVTESSEWTEHCSGFITIEIESDAIRSSWTRQLDPQETSSSSRSKAKETLSRMVDKSLKIVKPRDIYNSLHSAGIRHGPAFLNLEEVRVGPTDGVAIVALADTASLMPSNFEHDHVIHPTTLDTLFQTIYPIAADVSSEWTTAMVPVFLQSVFVSKDINSGPGHKLSVWSTIQEKHPRSIKASIVAVQGDEQTLPVVEISGLVCGAIGGAEDQDNESREMKKLCFQMRWAPDISFPLQPQPHVNGTSRNDEVNRFLPTDAIAQFSKIVELFVHKYPGAKVLEVSDGVESCVSQFLAAVGDNRRLKVSGYDCTAITIDQIQSDQNKVKDVDDIVNFKALDIYADPTAQGYPANCYNLVIVNESALDASKSMDDAIVNARNLLGPQGRLMILGRDNSDSEKEPTQWEDILTRNGFVGLDQHLQENTDRFVLLSGVTITKIPPDLYAGVSLLYGNEEPPIAWLHALSSALRSVTGHEPKFHSLARFDPSQAGGKLCVCVAELEKPLLDHLDVDSFMALQAMLTSAKAVLWVTRGGAVDCRYPRSSLVTGLFRVLRGENPLTQFITLDVDPKQEAWGVPAITNDIAEIVKKIVLESLPKGLPQDFEYAKRNGQILVPRIVEDAASNSAVSVETRYPQPENQLFSQPGRPLRMVAGTRGLLDSLRFVDDNVQTEKLPDDFVEIEPKAFGLNFRDIMVAMGQLNETLMGYECSGVVTQAGVRVTTVKVGDRVIGLTRGHYANFLRLSETNVIPVPSDMTFDTAASIPIVFATAYYSLREAARLRKDETILIHAGSGGVGQAAIMLAKLAGAEIFATVGTKEKRDFIVETYGIPADHIFNSRNTSFGKSIMEATGGRGVDVILNCLAGEILQESWNCIAALGRFVEIGKRDFELNNHLEMKPFTRNVAFFSVDLTYLLRHNDGKLLNSILKDVIDLMSAGKIHPVKPITVFSISEIERAFRLMQTGKHRGKVIIMPHPGDTVKALPVKRELHFRENASYIIVGGLGGIGRSICLWMAGHGAKHIILVSRSGSKQPDTQEYLARLREAGCEGIIVCCDVADQHQLTKVVQKASTTMPPIRGVIQAAMVLRDSIFERMTYESYMEALRPKVQGTWNLHETLSKTDLDFFIMLSSAAGIAGNGGQANYAAGSTFLDALARHRTAQGLPAVSLDLGVIGSVGYVAQNKELAARLEKAGYIPISENELLAIIQFAMLVPCRSEQASQVVTGIAATAASREGIMHEDLKFSDFIRSATTSGSWSDANVSDNSLSARLPRVESLSEAIDLIRTAIITKLSEDFMISESDIDPGAPLSSCGVDSLVAVELRNWILRQAKAECSIFDVLQSRSLTALAEKIAESSEFVSFESK